MHRSALAEPAAVPPRRASQLPSQSSCSRTCVGKHCVIPPAGRRPRPSLPGTPRLVPVRRNTKEGNFQPRCHAITPIPRGCPGLPQTCSPAPAATASSSSSPSHSAPRPPRPRCARHGHTHVAELYEHGLGALETAPSPGCTAWVTRRTCFALGRHLGCCGWFCAGCRGPFN